MSVHTGRNLKSFRELMGVSREELARRLGAGYTAEEIEGAEAKPQIEPDELNKMAKALQVEPATLLNYGNNPRIIIFAACTILTPLLVYFYILYRIMMINGALVPVEGSLKGAYQEHKYQKHTPYITTIWLKNSPGTFKRTYYFSDLQYRSYKDRLDNVLAGGTAQTANFLETYTFNPSPQDSLKQVVRFYITRADQQQLAKTTAPIPWFYLGLKSEPESKWDRYKDIDLYVCMQVVYGWVPYLSLALSLFFFLAGLTGSAQGKYIVSAKQNIRLMRNCSYVALFLNIVLLLGCKW